MRKVKYIRTIDNQIIVFPETIEHKRFKHFDPISAGFMSIVAIGDRVYNAGAIVQCSCYGESTSLGLVSNPEEDTKIANRQLFNNDNG